MDDGEDVEKKWTSLVTQCSADSEKTENSEDSLRAEDCAEEKQEISSQGHSVGKNFGHQAKENAKKKRTNKAAAKLKQTKLDARREQFLAQVTRSAHSLVKKVSSSTSKDESLVSPEATLDSVEDQARKFHQSSGLEQEGAAQVEFGCAEGNHSCRCENQSRKDEGLGHANGVKGPAGISNGVEEEGEKRGEKEAECTKPSAESREELPTRNSKKGKQKGGERRSKSPHDFPSNSKKGSGGKQNGMGLGAGNEGGECQEGDTDSVEDDWEAAADALLWQDELLTLNSRFLQAEIDPETFCLDSFGGKEKGHLPLQGGVQRNGFSSNGNGKKVDFHTREGGLRPEYQSTPLSFPFKSKSVNGVRSKAWKADDSGRPLTLPPSHSLKLAASQNGYFLAAAGHGHSFGGRNGSNLTHSPASCPICTEDLDMTDSSFAPCSCGFRLCLFCHHRIAIEDGRCPGCRRRYPDHVLKLSQANNVLLKN